jgi:hypothetical protein
MIQCIYHHACAQRQDDHDRYNVFECSQRKLLAFLCKDRAKSPLLILPRLKDKNNSFSPAEHGLLFVRIGATRSFAGFQPRSPLQTLAPFPIPRPVGPESPIRFWLNIYDAKILISFPFRGKNKKPG